MNKTYSDILNEMKNEFYLRCGENVEKYSELDLRFKAVASELYSLLCSGNYVLKQAFPQTAEGRYLDFHAQLRGIQRKTASNAALILIFSLSEPSLSDTVIEAGCICASHINPYIQFRTVERAVIPAGELSVRVSAEATVSGSVSNVEADTVTVIVNPVLTVAEVTNEAPFRTGFDDESDSMLRRRILSAYSIPSSGFSAGSIRESILTIDEILDCCVSNDGDELLVAVKTKSGTLDSDTLDRINEKLFVTDLFSYEKMIVPATKREFSLKLDIKCSSGDYSETQEQIIKRIKSFTSQMMIGETLYLSDIIYRACCVDSVEFCEAVCREAVDGAVICDSDEFLFLNGIEVICHE